MEGFDYQDVVALEKIADFLEKPAAFVGLFLEKDEAGFLDDIVLLHADGTVSAIQVKCSLHPERDEDPWNWEDLLKQEKKKDGTLKDSLIQKWAKSLLDCRALGDPVLGYLDTNRWPAEDISSVLDDESGTIRFESIKPEGRTRVLEQLGSEELAVSFFSAFRFRFEQADLPERENAVRQRLHRLNLSTSQCRALKDAIREWMKYKDEPGSDRPIGIEHIRSTVEWTILKRIPEGFAIPPDYVEPNEEFHSAVLAAVDSAQNSGLCLVIEGSPGSGKSTYLSHLCSQLHTEGLPVIRHHFFLSLKDPIRGRGSYETTGKSLMEQLQREYAEELGTLTTRNPSVENLGEWIEAVGAAFASAGSSVTIIVDGLDYVWREGPSLDDLNRLFDQLLPVPAGVALLVGTQPVPEDVAPQKLIRLVPQGEWLRLPLLEKRKVKGWFTSYAEDLGVTSDNANSSEYLVGQLSEAFWEKTQGHPLCMQYTLQALLNGPLPVTPTLVQNQPDCPEGDIRNYYGALWARLDESAKEIIHLLCCTGFPIPSDGLYGILDPDGTRHAALTSACRKVVHLLDQGPLGIRPFHNSLVEYVKRLSDHEGYKHTLLPKVSNWLRDGAPTHWQWAYAPVLGNVGAPSIAEPWQWAIEGVAKRHAAQLGKAVLGSCAAHALRSGDLYGAVNVGLLKDYYEMATERNKEVVEALLSCQLYLQDDEYLVARLEESLETLSEHELVVLAEWADTNDRSVLFCRCRDQLIDLLRDPHRRTSNHDTLGEIRYYLRLAGACSSFPASRIANFLIKNRGNINTVDAIDEYCRTVRSRKNIRHLHDLLSADLRDDEAEIVQDELALAYLDLGEVIRDDDGLSSPILDVLRMLGGKAAEPSPSHPFPDPGVLLLRGYEADENACSVKRFFRRAFYVMLSNELIGHSSQADSWLSSIGKHTWQRRFTHVLHDVATALAQIITKREIPSFGWLFQKTSVLQKPSWGERDEYYYGTIAEATLLDLCNDIAAMRAYIGQDSEVDLDALARAEQTEHFNQWRWLSHAVRTRQPLLRRDVAAKWIAERRDEVLTWPEPASTRADSLAELCNYAAILGLSDLARECLSSAARHLLAHGAHKDMILFQALDVIGLCHENEITDTLPLLEEVSRRIVRVGEFTDGDETNYLPKELASLLVRINPELLLRYYLWSADSQQFDLAEHAFAELIHQADLSDPLQRALVGTAVDDKALEAISLRALEPNDTIAESLKREMMEYIRPSEKDEDSPHAGLSGSEASSKKAAVPLGQFPPERLADFIRESTGEGYSERIPSARIRDWMEYWCNHADCRAVVRALEKVATRRALGYGFGFMPIYDFVLRRLGPSSALPWLIRDSREFWGWNEWASSEEVERARWELVKEHHPEDWRAYLVGCFNANPADDGRAFTMSNRVARLAKFLAFFDRNALVEDVLGALMYVIRQITEIYQFDPLPWWSDE